jgi:tRNA A58 N-methylase Trm61
VTHNRALEDLVDDDPGINRPSDEPIHTSEELYRLAQTRDGKMLYNPRDVCIGASIERYGEFSYLEAALLVQLCSPGDTVIDVGANIGTHTVALSKRVGPQGFVYAFEPQQAVFQVLCANMALTNQVIGRATL